MVRIKKPSDRNWFDDTTKRDEMKTLGATELSILRRFVKDVLETINYDDTGVTDDLADGAEASAEILGIVVMPSLDEDDPYTDYFVKSDDEEG